MTPSMAYVLRPTYANRPRPKRAKAFMKAKEEKKKKGGKAVSFSGCHAVKRFSPCMRVQSPPTHSSMRNLEVTEWHDGDKTEQQRAIDLQVVRMTLEAFRCEVRANPLEYMLSGDVVKLLHPEKILLTHTSPYMYVEKLETPEGMVELDECLIATRGTTLKNLLLRSPRTLDHDRYTNSIVNYIYCHLTPVLRAKTDAEWLFRRAESRTRTLYGE